MVLLSDAELQQLIKPAPANGLNEKFSGSFRLRCALLRRHFDQCLGDPSIEIRGGAAGLDLGVRDLDGDLDAPFPAALLHIEDAGMSAGFTLHLLRSEEQRDSVLRRFKRRVR